MFGLILLAIMDGSLVVGILQDNENLLNVAEFLMWLITIMTVLLAFASDEILRTDYHHIIVIVLTRTITIVSLIMLVYYGFILAPVIWIIAWIVRLGRKHQLNTGKRW